MTLPGFFGKHILKGSLFKPIISMIACHKSSILGYNIIKHNSFVDFSWIWEKYPHTAHAHIT